MTRKQRQKAAKTTTNQLQSATSRLKLAARTRPYFVKVASGAWVGYRKPLSGPGMWAARVGNGEGRGWEKTLWQADDNGLKADGEKVLSFWMAKTEVQKLAGKRPGASTSGSLPDESSDVPLTLDEALKAYKVTLSERGARTSNAGRPRHHLSEKLLAKPVPLISEKELKDWRDSMLASGSAPSSVNRTMTNLRAALTIACPDLTQRWRSGLQALELDDATVANNVVLTEAQAQALVAEAYVFEHQLGLLTHTLAETGARPSQAVRLRIRDLITADPKAPRLLMPKSGKGRIRNPQKRKLERYSVSISTELAALLKAAAKGRLSNAPLLLRNNGQPWRQHDPAGDYRPDMRKVVETAGLDPDVTMYSLRHTSITRMLLSGVHTGIVAKAHDTSEAMIRRHYAANILDFSDEITRKSLPSFGPLAPAADNVVKLQTRRDP